MKLNGTHALLILNILYINSMLDKALETNSTQLFDRKQRLKEIEEKLKDELILTKNEINHLEYERINLLKDLKDENRKHR